MRSLLIFGVVVFSLLLTGGCTNGPLAIETAFMQQQNGETFFQEFGAREGMKCTRWSGSSNSGGLPCRNQFHIEIDGGSPVRDKLMIAYHAHIRAAITASGATINGEGTLGDERSMSSFDLNYANGAVVGFFFATAVVNHRGKVDIFVVMYEH